MTRNGLLASLPFVAAGGTMIATGQVADRLRSPRGRLSTTAVRKIFCVCGFEMVELLCYQSVASELWGQGVHQSCPWVHFV